MTDRPEFSVCQFFPDDTYEYVRRFVSAEEAVTAAKHYTESVGARLGTTRRVIITDGGDYTVFEWQFGKGVTFPTREQCAKAQGGEGDWFRRTHDSDKAFGLRNSGQRDE